MKSANTFRIAARVSLVLMFFLGRLSVAQDTSLASPQGDPPTRVARIGFLRGNVSFLRAGLDQWSEAVRNFPVTTGDRLYTTDAEARAELQVGPYTVRLAGGTDLTVTNLDDEILQLGLDQGTLRISAYQMPLGNTVEIDTPIGALTLLAPGTYRVDTDPDADQTTVTVNSGSLEITGAGISQTLRAGEAIRLTGRDPIHVETIPPPFPDSFDEWSEARDLHLSSSLSRRYLSPGMPGYDDLDEYGHWEEVAAYGPVWYPAGVAMDWVPYRFGHWLWVGPWGWTWVEDEPWGFCPFHYGRWVHIGLAWGWLPGPIVPLPVYAPAFVAFLGGPGFSISVAVGGGLVGWFPLGPGEPFFPWYHVGVDYLRLVNITNVRSVTIITNITKITNINDVHYAYRTIATTAVPPDVFSSGRFVAHSMVKLSPQQLSRAQVIPHPSVNPTIRAALGGRPVPRPRVYSRPLAANPSTTLRQTVPSPGNLRESPAVRGEAGRRPPVVPPGLITRKEPPPPRIPFPREQHALLAHPGRALEPQQIENMRIGRSPGPMIDREFPPHPAPRRLGIPPPPKAR
jgi:hypothetical protein